MSWIEAIVALGDRPPGSASDRATRDYRRSPIVPRSAMRATSGRSRGVTGELCDAGLPVVGLLAGVPYIFFKEDTPAAAMDQLVPTIDLLATLLFRADRLSRAELLGDGIGPGGSAT